MKTDTSEKGLEALIVAGMTGRTSAPTVGGFSEEPEPFIGLHNWLIGNPKAYDRTWTVDLLQLGAFIAATQPPLVAAFDLDNDSPARQKFLARVQGEIGKRGVIDVLRNGVKHGAHDVDVFYGTPSPGNLKAAERFALNRFSVTRQLRYSRDDTAHALDLALFINGLPIATFELKNSLTKQTDPEFDTKRATKKLRRYVESNDHAIRLKAEIMVDHFHEQVLALNKVGGQARAMVVTSGIERAIQYYQAVSAYLLERKSPYRAIVAFSGEPEFRGAKVTEASLNGFPSKDIVDQIETDPYRFLICADKFQTGYDQPLLHSMYVDKALSGIKAVQTLSRLNRAHPQKHDVFVLDFMNDTETIRSSFDTFYRTTILSDETDPNRLHDLKATLDGYQVYESAQIEQLVGLYLSGADRDRLDPILDACVATYDANLDEDGQVDFKGKAKAFTRTYEFISSVLPYTNADWEKLSIFLNFLVPKLPAPREEDLSKGILESIDMDSYRVEKQAAQRVQLSDQDAEIDPVPTDGGGHKAEPELDRLSNIIRSFNDLFGNISWTDTDRIRRLIATEIPDKVAANAAYQNAKQNSDKQNARIEHDKALAGVIVGLMKDDTELFKQFSDNPEFKRWLTDAIFSATYDRPTPPAP